MKRPSPVICFAFALAVLAGGCNKSSATSATPPSAAIDSASLMPSATPPQGDRDAITEAIRRHLGDNKGINMSAMEMNVGNVAVNGDQAQADTEFRLKQGGTSMLITYFLERHGAGWIVVRNQPSSAGQFAHPPMDKVHSGSATTPPLPDVSAFLKSHPSQKPN
jgi:hypothetical protein